MFLRTGHETFMYLLFVYIVYIDINLKIFYPIKINGDDFIFISFFFFQLVACFQKLQTVLG